MGAASRCCFDDQFVDGCTAQPFGIIDVGAFLILGKRAPGFFFITINLPTTAVFTAVSLMKNEAADVLGRIPEKQSDFVRKFGTLFDSAFQPVQTGFAVKAFVSH